MELLLGEGSGFEVAGAFSNCDKVVEQVTELDPQLVIMDIDMPGIGGISGVKKIKTSFPEIKVVMYTVFDDDNRIFDCICSGADGYLLKNTSPVKLIQSLTELMEGGAPMSPFVAQKVFQFFRKNSQNSYKMIADKSHVTIDTVKKHLQNIYHKLHVNCGTEAVAKALQHKIVRLD
jgi:DNA-binding NarL/FixJ family response regulator